MTMREHMYILGTWFGLNRLSSWLSGALFDLSAADDLVGGGIFRHHRHPLTRIPKTDGT